MYSTWECEKLCLLKEHASNYESSPNYFRFIILWTFRCHKSRFNSSPSVYGNRNKSVIWLSCSSLIEWLSWNCGFTTIIARSSFEKKSFNEDMWNYYSIHTRAKQMSFCNRIVKLIKMQWKFIRKDLIYASCAAVEVEDRDSSNQLWPTSTANKLSHCCWCCAQRSIKSAADETESKFSSPLPSSSCFFNLTLRGEIIYILSV